MGQPDPEPLTRAKASGLPLEARLGWLGIATAVLDLGTVYVKIPAGRPGLTVGDGIDLLSMYVLVGLYAWIAAFFLARDRGARPEAPSTGAPGWIPALLVLSAVTFVLGHGVHLSANSIHDALARASLDDPGRLVGWWDETAGHALIDSAKLGLCVAVTALEATLPPSRVTAAARRTREAGTRPAALVFNVGALAYGFIYFASAVEGQTVPLLLPFGVLYAAWALARAGAEKRAGTEERSLAVVRRFFATGFAVATALFAVWGIWHRGFPEFSSVGLIP